MKLFLLIVCITCSLEATKAGNYYTPGTGVNWSLGDLVANAASSISYNGSFYTVTDSITIRVNDTINIYNDGIVKFSGSTGMFVLGTLLINPLNSVVFTAENTTTGGFLGIRIEGPSTTTSILRKLTLEYAVSLRLNDVKPVIDSCIFQYNNFLASTTFGNGAIALFRASPLITNCRFLNNKRAAIQGGSNINNAPKIINCIFEGNNTSNTNVPQINLGATSAAGEDTVKILNNKILRSSTNSGGIGFLPIGNVYAVISGNLIINNRYGLTFNGGSNINAIVSYNQIDSNNTQNNPALGGSGIAFSGGSSSSHQNVIVHHNLIRWNLWGITIQNFAKPNLGDITNTNPDDDGYNSFIDNNNLTTPGIDLYNNSPDDIMAQNNFWGTSDALEIENKIFHQPDNAALGLVNYSSFQVVPVTLVSFTATNAEHFALLRWKTSSASGIENFTLERSTNGRNFFALATFPARNGSGIDNYEYSDYGFPGLGSCYYRLKIIEQDSRYSYSNTLYLSGKKENKIMIYPSVISNNPSVAAIISTDVKQKIWFILRNATGKEVFRVTRELSVGSNAEYILIPAHLPGGVYFLGVYGDGVNETFRLLK